MSSMSSMYKFKESQVWTVHAQKMAFQYMYYILAVENITFLAPHHVFQPTVLRQTMYYLDRVKRIWYLSPMRAARVQAVSQEEPWDRKPDP